MQIQELTTREYLSHLHRHPMPEIMDDECLAALSSVMAQYGDAITHGAGLEVRLGEELRYVDYIMNIDEETIPDVKALWYEIDYDEYMNVYRSHKALMGYMGISDFTYLNSNIRQSFDGEYAFVSAPGAEQRGTLSVNSMFAITTQCTHPEGAWDFVSSFLT